MRECQDLPLADRQFTARGVPSVAMAARLRRTFELPNWLREQDLEVLGELIEAGRSALSSTGPFR
jgi:hypothetical protein